MNDQGLARHFDGIFYSAKLGYRKPAQDFFRLATEAIGARPDEIGFIDDAAENIDGARQFGWGAVHWTPGMQLSEVLAHLQALLARKGGGVCRLPATIGPV
jgi:putative hydrolase of the HAD superfamily